MHYTDRGLALDNSCHDPFDVRVKEGKVPARRGPVDKPNPSGMCSFVRTNFERRLDSKLDLSRAQSR